MCDGIGCWRFYYGTLTAKGVIFGILDRHGNFLSVDDINFAYHFSGGLAVAQRGSDGKFGFLDKTGKWAIEPQFSLAGPFSEGLAMVLTADDKIGFIDPTGRFAIDPYDCDIDFYDSRFIYFNSGLCPAPSHNNNKMGIHKPYWPDGDQARI